MNGSDTTTDEFYRLSSEKRQEIIESLEEFAAYGEVSAGDKDFLLVHAALSNFSPERSLDDYTLDELVWGRTGYGMKYFDDVYAVSGISLRKILRKIPVRDIYRANHHIAIDCGTCKIGI